MNNKEKIETIIKNNSRGVTIKEIKRKIGLSTNTVLISLAELKGEKSINIEKIGPTNVYYWKN